MVFLLRSSRCQIICSDALRKQGWNASRLRLLESTASQQVKWNSTHHHVDDDIAPSTRSSAAPHIQQQRSSSDEQLAQSTRTTRVAVAMSGGVDSSVAAYLLQQMSKSSSSSHQLFVDGSNNTSISVNKHCSNSSNTSNVTAPKEGSNASLDIIGLHMSNWNALDEDSDENLTNNTGSRRKQGQKMSKRDTASHEKSSNQQQHQSLSSSSPAANNSRSSSSSTTFCQTSENEYNDAKSVAQHLDIPLHRVSFASEYWVQVFEPFIESLSSSSSSSSPSSSSFSSGDEHHHHQQQQQGMTMPNPDYGCNTYIKFGAMKDYALDKLHADYVATGHYAQLWHRDYLNNNRTTLLSSNEPSSSLSAFHEWMVEMSKSLEGQVLESIAGRPEEEWILNNNNVDATTKTMTIQPPLPMLLAGADRSKDQTYFLSGVKGEALRNVIFPLGHLAKQHHQQQSKSSDSQVFNSSDSSSNDNFHNHQTVREIAQNAQIPTASKRDSMGICFIGKRNFGQFISQYLPKRHIHPGNFIDIDTGKIVGIHDGVARYTLGEGAKISGANVRYFVCGKGRRSSAATTQQSEHANNNNENTVFVCNSTHHPALYSDELFVDFDSFNWIGLGGDIIGGQDSSSSSSSSVRYNHIPRPLNEGKSIRLLARVRHLQPLTGCTVTWDRSSSTPNTMMNNGSGSTRGYLVIRFDKAMRAITPGQIVALYAGSDGLVCLGGGVIGGSGLSYLDRGLDVTNGSIHPSGNNDLSLRTAT